MRYDTRALLLLAVAMVACNRDRTSLQPDAGGIADASVDAFVEDGRSPACEAAVMTDVLSQPGQRLEMDAVFDADGFAVTYVDISGHVMFTAFDAAGASRLAPMALTDVPTVFDERWPPTASVAAGPNDYVVVWNDNDPVESFSTVYAKLVLRDFSTRGTVQVNTSLDSGGMPVNAHRPQVQWSGVRYDILWNDRRRNDPARLGQNHRLDGYYVVGINPDPLIVIGERQVTQAAFTHHLSPAFVGTADRLTVVWRTRDDADNDGTFEYPVHLKTTSGESSFPSDPPGVVYGDANLRVQPKVTTRASGFTLGWRVETEGELWDVELIETGPSGTPSGEPERLSGGERSIDDLWLGAADGEAVVVVTVGVRQGDGAVVLEAGRMEGSYTPAGTVELPGVAADRAVLLDGLVRPGRVEVLVGTVGADSTRALHWATICTG